MDLLSRRAAEPGEDEHAAGARTGGIPGTAGGEPPLCGCVRSPRPTLPATHHQGAARHYGGQKAFFSVADPDPGTGAFLTPGSGIRDG